MPEVCLSSSSGMGVWPGDSGDSGAGSWGCEVGPEQVPAVVAGRGVPQPGALLPGPPDRVREDTQVRSVPRGGSGRAGVPGPAAGGCQPPPAPACPRWAPALPQDAQHWGQLAPTGLGDPHCRHGMLGATTERCGMFGYLDVFKHPEVGRFGAPHPNPLTPVVQGVSVGLRPSSTVLRVPPGADAVPAVPAAGAGVHHLAGGGDPQHLPPRLHHHHQILGHSGQEPLPGGERGAPTLSLPGGHPHLGKAWPYNPQPRTWGKHGPTTMATTPYLSHCPKPVPQPHTWGKHGPITHNPLPVPQPHSSPTAPYLSHNLTPGENMAPHLSYSPTPVPLPHTCPTAPHLSRPPSQCIAGIWGCLASEGLGFASVTPHSPHPVASWGHLGPLQPPGMVGGHSCAATPQLRQEKQGAVSWGPSPHTMIPEPPWVEDLQLRSSWHSWEWSGQFSPSPTKPLLRS